MEVIVNNQTPLTVKDQEGKVLFQWLPQERLKNITELHMKPMSDDDKKRIIEQLRNAPMTIIPNAESTTPSEHVRNSIQDTMDEE